MPLSPAVVPVSHFRDQGRQTLSQPIIQQGCGSVTQSYMKGSKVASGEMFPYSSEVSKGRKHPSLLYGVSSCLPRTAASLLQPDQRLMGLMQQRHKDKQKQKTPESLTRLLNCCPDSDTTLFQDHGKREIITSVVTKPLTDPGRQPSGLITGPRAQLSAILGLGGQSVRHTGPS